MQFLDRKLGLRNGQKAADCEDFVSQTATLVVNSTYGWLAILGLDLPSGGPADPLATPAIRAKYVPGNGFSLQAELYDGDPAGADHPEPQRLDRTGTNFRTHDLASTAIDYPRRGNAGLYAIYDQTLYRGSGKDDEGLGAFIRAALSPNRSSVRGLLGSRSHMTAVRTDGREAWSAVGPRLTPRRDRPPRPAPARKAHRRAAAAGRLGRRASTAGC